MSQPTALAGQPAAPAQPQPQAHTQAPAQAGPGNRTVEIVVPVYNEERVLAASVRRLHAYLTENFPYRFGITVADNASTDDHTPGPLRPAGGVGLRGDNSELTFKGFTATSL